VISLLKATGGPGSIAFLILAILLGLGIIYVWPKRRRLGALWIIAVSACYLVLGLPVVARTIADHLPRMPARDGNRPISVLIILDGDNRRGRVRLAQEIMASDRPAHVWALGDEWLLDALAEGGVSPASYRLDGRAGNTLQQMHQIARLLAETTPGQAAAVVASRLQAPRVAALAEALAIPVIVLAAPVDAEPPAIGIRRFLPAYTALRISRDALYEHAALWWYARQGWIRSPAATR
jgi:hypothetical protein